MNFAEYTKTPKLYIYLASKLRNKKCVADNALIAQRKKKCSRLLISDLRSLHNTIYELIKYFYSRTMETFGSCVVQYHKIKIFHFYVILKKLQMEK